MNIDQFKALLLTRKGEIHESRKDPENNSKPKELDQTRVGRLSRIDAMQQQAMSNEARRLQKMELQRIKSALERIESGEYGYCIICDEEIAEKRLLFDPSLLTCIECARQAEKKTR